MVNNEHDDDDDSVMAYIYMYYIVPFFSLRMVLTHQNTFGRWNGERVAGTQ